MEKLHLVLERGRDACCVIATLFLVGHASLANAQCAQLQAHIGTLRNHVASQVRSGAPANAVSTSRQALDSTVSIYNRRCAGGGAGSSGGVGGAGGGGGDIARAMGLMSTIIGLALQQQAREGQQHAVQAEAQWRALEQEDALRRATAAAEELQRIASAQNPFDTTAASSGGNNPFDPPTHRLDGNKINPTTFETQLHTPAASGGAAPAGGRNVAEGQGAPANPFDRPAELHVDATQAPVQPFGRAQGERPSGSGVTSGPGRTGPVAGRIPSGVSGTPGRQRPGSKAQPQQGETLALNAPSGGAVNPRQQAPRPTRTDAHRPVGVGGEVEEVTRQCLRIEDFEIEAKGTYNPKVGVRGQFFVRNTCSFSVIHGSCVVSVERGAHYCGYSGLRGGERGFRQFQRANYLDGKVHYAWYACKGVTPECDRAVQTFIQQRQQFTR